MQLIHQHAQRGFSQKCTSMNKNLTMFRSAANCRAACSCITKLHAHAMAAMSAQRAQPVDPPQPVRKPLRATSIPVWPFEHIKCSLMHSIPDEALRLGREGGARALNHHIRCKVPRPHALCQVLAGHQLAQEPCSRHQLLGLAPSAPLPLHDQSSSPLHSGPVPITI